jgi:hypothetical protein
MTLTVFTAIVGETDVLKPPTFVHPGVRYVVLSDRQLAVPPYVCIRLTAQELAAGPRLVSRRLKILADHPGLGSPEVTLWHDAAFRMDCDPVAVSAWALADGVDMLAFAHPHRTQIEDEAEAIAKWGWVPRETLLEQVRTYRAEGFRQTMITSTGFCIRRMSELVKAFNALWWGEVAKWGWRDQMSVDYAIWKAGIRLRYIPGHYRDNPHARWFKW